MKKLLLLLPVLGVVLFSGCHKDDDDDVNVTLTNVIGKWAVYETVKNGTTTSADLNQQLSYIELRTNHTYDLYNYYDSEVSDGTFTLSGNSITLSDDGKYTVTRLTGNEATVRDNSGMIYRLRKSSNMQQFYLEPSKDFGASMTKIRQDEKRTFDKESGAFLFFKNSTRNEQYVAYHFEDSKMDYAVVSVSNTADMDDLYDYLDDKYSVYGESDDVTIFSASGYQVSVYTVGTTAFIVYGDLVNTTLSKEENLVLVAERVSEIRTAVNAAR